MEEATPKRQSTVLREKGFIITKGATSRRGTIETVSQEGTSNEPYYWDEPWTGSNGPRASTETARSQEAPTTSRASPTAELEIAMPMSITRINSTTITTSSSPQPEGGIGVKFDPTKGVGILPETSTVSGTERNGSSPSSSVARQSSESEGHKKSQESTRCDESHQSEGSQSIRERSSVEQESKSMQQVDHAGREYEGSDDNSTVQQPSIVEDDLYSIGFPSVISGPPPISPIQPRTPVRTRTSFSKRLTRSSWADFDFEIPSERSSFTGPSQATKPQKGRKRFSFLDDAFRDSVYMERNTRTHGRRSSDLLEGRPWMIWGRTDEIDREGAI